MGCDNKRYVFAWGGEASLFPVGQERIHSYELRKKRKVQEERTEKNPNEGREA